MRRTLIRAGLAAIVLLLFASISATVAAPGNIPLLQSTSESEPNNSFDEADLMDAPGYIIGSVKNTPVEETIDYFKMFTTVGREYQASLTIDSPQDLRLRMVLYNGDRGYLKTSSSSDTGTSLSWIASKDLHYVRVEAVTVSTSTVQSASYRLDIDLVAATATPTVTPTPTNTPPPGEDAYEDNDTMETAYTFAVATSVSATDANFVPSDTDQDWFRFYVKDGRRYRASTSNLDGVDTYLEVFNVNGDLGDRYDNDSGGGFASKVEWEANYDGYYYIRVTNLVSTSGSEHTYDLTVTQISDSDEPTSTPGPEPTSPKADRCDKTRGGNYNFEEACVISANVSEEFNFYPPPFGGPDNDFFKIWVKPGLLFQCATSNLSPGVDTNMIVYDGNENPIGGNDDVEPGNYESYFAYYATYEGWMYLLVGTGDRTPGDLSNSKYTLRCSVNVPGQPTATSTPEPDATPTSRTATPTSPSSQAATSTPAPDLTVRTLTTPTPVPATTPAPRFIPIRLLVYYDGNDDRQPGAGEGISGISAQAYEVATNQLLAQGFTDDQGNLEFTVAAQGPVRVSVPFFGFSQLVAGEGASIYLRVPPKPLPGGAP